MRMILKEYDCLPLPRIRFYSDSYDIFIGVMIFWYKNGVDILQGRGYNSESGITSVLCIKLLASFICYLLMKSSS